MDIDSNTLISIKRILVSTVILSFFIYGLIFLFRRLGGGRFKKWDFLQAIWRKEEQLTFKDGLIIGYIYAVFKVSILIINFMITGNIDSPLYAYIQDGITILALCVAIVALFRAKFKFIIGFIVGDFCLSISFTSILTYLILTEMFKAITEIRITS